MNRLIIVEHYGVSQVEAAEFATRGSSLEEALRKAAVEIGYAESADDLNIRSTHEMAEFLGELLGNRLATGIVHEGVVSG